jgi:hypothetical protein
VAAWTDDDVEAVARPFRERAEELGMAHSFDFTRIVLQLREEERERLKTSQFKRVLSGLREWLTWHTIERWHPEEEAEIQVEIAGELPDQIEIDWGSGGSRDFTR